MSNNKKILEQLSQQTNKRNSNPPSQAQNQVKDSKTKNNVADDKVKPQSIFMKLLIISILLAIIAGATYYYLPKTPETSIVKDPPTPTLEKGLAEYNQALNYYNEQKWVDAYDNFSKALNLGNQKAKYYLGMLYFGDEQYTTLYKDRDKSFKYLSEFPTIPDKANDGLGYAHLGYMYMTGQGTTRNLAKGEEMYEKGFEDAVKAGISGLFMGQYGIANLYYNGFHGVPVNKEKAKLYLDREAAENPIVGLIKLSSSSEEEFYSLFERKEHEVCGDKCKRTEGVEEREESNPFIEDYKQEGNYSDTTPKHN